jgi:VWFA-related protein
MKLGITGRYLGLTILAGLLLGSSLGIARSPQNQEGGPSGPKPDVGDTVLAPKKTTPSPGTTSSPSTTTQTAPKGPERINPNEVFTLTTTTNLVNVDVLVVDNSGNPIGGLGKVNFKLYDEGVPQTISNFGTGEAPMTICMLIEFSNKWWPFLYIALRDSYEFVRVIEPKDWVAVVTFDMRTKMLQDFTQNRYEVTQAIDQLRIPGFSEINLYDALAETIDKMKDIQGRKAILVICTGIDTFSKLTYDQMLKIAKNSDTVIYPISILEFVNVRTGGGGIGEAQARATLTYVAKYSGGQSYFPRFEAEMPSVYQQISTQLRQQYSLGFVPTNSTHDGKFRKLKIDLVDAQGNPLKVTDQKGKNVKYKVVAREGYYSPKT